MLPALASRTETCRILIFVLFVRVSVGSVIVNVAPSPSVLSTVPALLYRSQQDRLSIRESEESLQNFKQNIFFLK